jgi:signal peptidase II
MFASLALLTSMDLGSKQWALDHLSYERTGAKPPLCVPDELGQLDYQRIPTARQPLVEGVINLRYAENCGAAFSMLRTAPRWLRVLVFGVASLAACVVLVTLFVRNRGGKAFALAVPLVTAGALGNASDRIRHGFVVDFIQIDPRVFTYPVFNVADALIAVGVGLLLLDGVKKSRDSAADATTKTKSVSRHSS